MKVLYITTAMEKDDYRLFSRLWSKQPNPSNQNFNNKMIRAIADNFEVDVLSIRPLSRTLCSVRSLPQSDRKEGNITWRYTCIKGGSKKRLKLAFKDFKKSMGRLDLSDYVIFVDTINPICLKTASKIKEIYNLPLVGVCTTSPSNIQGTRRSYSLKIFEMAKECDGYICLTNHLNKLYNDNNKPSLVFEGIVENELEQNKIEVEKPYFFYSGTMLARYGVYNLIKAFKTLNNTNIELLIAGHTVNMNELNTAINRVKNIKYLGTLPTDQVIRYQAGSIANINPRPATEDLNRYSVPSKLLEYLASGSLTISTKNPTLSSNIEDAIWIPTNSVDDIKAGLIEALDMKDRSRIATANKAREKVSELYSINSIGKRLNEYLEAFKKQD